MVDLGVLGPFLWLASRALGVAAYVALTLEVLLGLSASTALLDRSIPRSRLIELHRWLSAIGLSTLGLHALLLLGDPKAGLSLAEVLMPFRSSYRPFAVGLGILAGYLALVVHVSGWLRKHLGARRWRQLHALTFVLFVFATFHGILAGTDSAAFVMQGLYVGATSLVSCLVFLRLFQTVVRREAGRPPDCPDGT